MSNESNAFWGGFGVAILVIAVLILVFPPRRLSEERAVREGHAHYNAMTGDFEWNKPCGEQPKKEQP